MTFPGPDSKCSHPSFRLGLQGRWILCNRCHRLVIAGDVVHRICLAAEAGEPVSDETAVRMIREMMDAWTPGYYLETDDAPARTP